MSSSATSQRLVLMGAILGAHGIKGEVKVKSFAAKPAAIADYGPLIERSGARGFVCKGDLSGAVIERLLE